MQKSVIAALEEHSLCVLLFRAVSEETADIISCEYKYTNRIPGGLYAAVYDVVATVYFASVKLQLSTLSLQYNKL
jgi:hypothetical protein